MWHVFRMHSVGVRVLQSAQATPRRCRYGSRRFALAAVRSICSSTVRPARPERPDDLNAPTDDEQQQPDNGVRPDGEAAASDKDLDTPSSLPTAAPVLVPPPTPAALAPEPASPTESLHEAFSGVAGRARAVRSRSQDGLPAVRLPEWFLRGHVRVWERPRPLRTARSPISEDLAAARRLLFPNIELPEQTASFSADDAVQDRERMQLFFEWVLDGAAWDDKNVSEAVSDMQRGDLNGTRSRSAAVTAAASYLVAALAYRRPRPAKQTEATPEPDTVTSTEITRASADLSIIDPDNALTIPDVLATQVYRDHIAGLVEHGVDYCVRPGADEDVARGLPFNCDFGERIGFSELYATVAAEFRAESPSKPAKDLRRPVSVLAVMNYTGRGKAVSVVDNVASCLSASVVHLDAAVLADIAGTYLGQTVYCARGTISMLGYTAAEKNGRLARRQVAKDDEDDDPDSSLVGTRLPIAFVRHGLGGRLSAKAYTSEMDDKWDDLKMNNVLEAMIRAADPPLSAAVEPHKVILHVHNFFELSSTVDGNEMLNKLRSITDRLWQRKRHIVLVGSAAAHADAKPSLAERAEELRQEGYHIIPFRVQGTSPGSLAAQMERQDYVRENMGNIRSLMTAMAGRPAAGAAGGWDGAWAGADETLQATLSHVVYDIDWVYRLVALALANRSRRPDAASFADALRLLGGQELWWEKRTGARAPYYSPLAAGPDAAGGDGTATPVAEYNEHEKKLLAGVIDKEKLTTTFADVVCPVETADSLKALTSLSLVRPEAFLYGVLATERIPGCLLYGPPGTGKTLLAKAVAKQGGASMIEVSAANINDMWLGNSEKNVQALFSLARKMAPVVIFLDEADALLGARQTGPGGRAAHRETITQFLREWDGLHSTHAFIMVATNRPFDLDEAVLRRLPRRILVDLPLRDGRLRILQVLLKDEHLDPAVSLDQLAADTELYSGSDLKNMCVAAAMEAVREEVRAHEAHPGPEPFVFADRRVLRRAHFDRALQDIGASISEDMSSLQAIRHFDERYGDRRKKKRRHMGFEVIPHQPTSEGALVRQPAT